MARRGFSSTFENIEWVSGGDGDDIFELESEGGGSYWVDGRGGENWFFFDDDGGHYTIMNFGQRGDDTLVIDGAELGLTKSDVIAAARSEEGGVLIDLSSYGGPRIHLVNYDITEFSQHDFLL